MGTRTRRPGNQPPAERASPTPAPGRIGSPDSRPPGGLGARPRQATGMSGTEAPTRADRGQRQLRPLIWPGVTSVRSACWQLSGPRRGTMRNRSALACSRLKIQNFEVYPAGPCAGQDPSPRHARIFKLPGTGTLAVRWGSVPLEVLCQHYAPFRALVVGHARASAPRDHAAGRGIGSTWGCRIPVPRLDGRGLVRHATFGDFVERRQREARRCGGAV